MTLDGDGYVIIVIILLFYIVVRYVKKTSDSCCCFFMSFNCMLKLIRKYAPILIHFLIEEDICLNRMFSKSKSRIYMKIMKIILIFFFFCASPTTLLQNVCFLCPHHSCYQCNNINCLNWRSSNWKCFLVGRQQVFFIFTTLYSHVSFVLFFILLYILSLSSSLYVFYSQHFIIFCPYVCIHFLIIIFFFFL